MLKDSMRLTPLLVSLVLVTACQAQNAQPQPAEPAPVTAEEQEFKASLTDLLESSRQVEQRITLMQEQVIKLNEQMQVSQQRSLQIMQAMQQLQIAQSKQVQQAQTSEDKVPEPVPTVSEEQLATLNAKLDELSMSFGNKSGEMGFHLVSAYTPKGQWVIFKYDEASGLTWSAQDGGWVEVTEIEALPASRYQVVLRPAAGDVKGYVAARVDQITGRSWWLKGNTWEPFQ